MSLKEPVTSIYCDIRRPVTLYVLSLIQYDKDYTKEFYMKPLNSSNIYVWHGCQTLHRWIYDILPKFKEL